eukprot:scaffold112208_cov54-Phaeocystis_antarctica.AAC.1
MKKAGITCADFKYGIDGYCAGSWHKEKGQYFDTDHCQQTCFHRNETLSANCCQPPPPSPPPPSPCVMCGDDMPPGLKKNFGYTCGDWRDASSPNQRAVELLMDKACSKQKWIEEDSRGRGPYCQQSCSDAGCGSTDCCPSPRFPSLPPSPPVSPPSSPVITEANFKGKFYLKQEADGQSVTSSRPDNSPDRRALVSAPPSLGDAGPVLPAGDVTRRGLQVQEEKVVLEIPTGGILILATIGEDVEEALVSTPPSLGDAAPVLPAGHVTRRGLQGQEEKV